MLNLTATKPQLNVVFDQAGTPTYAYDLAVAIKAVLEDYAPNCAQNVYDKTGIYHFSNEGVCSWYDFTKKIAELCPAIPPAISVPATATNSPAPSPVRPIPYWTKRRLSRLSV